MCIDGRGIPSPRIREIIERMSLGIFPHMLLLILVGCCFLLFHSIFLSHSLSFFLHLFLLLSRQCRSEMLKGNLPLNAFKYHSRHESNCETHSSNFSLLLISLQLLQCLYISDVLQRSESSHLWIAERLKSLVR